MWKAYAAGSACALLGSCAPPVFPCSSDAQCAGGQCELAGYCSFPDDDCASGHRFGEHAGQDLADKCVSPSNAVGDSEGPGGGDDGTSSGATAGTSDPGDDDDDNSDPDVGDDDDDDDDAVGSSDTGSTAPSCLVDDFDDADLSGWSVIEPGNVTEAGSLLRVAVDADAGGWPGIESPDPYDMTLGHVRVLLGATAPGTEVEQNLRLAFDADGSTAMVFSLSGDTMIVRSEDPDLIIEHIDVPWSAAEVRRLQVRVDDFGIVFFETSNNGVDWQHVVGVSPTADEDVTRVWPGLRARALDPSVTATEVSFDEIEICPNGA